MAVSVRPSGTFGRASLWCLSRSSSPHKCRSRLGFSLGLSWGFTHTFDSVQNWIFGRTPSCGASGWSRESRPPVSTRAGFGGLQQPALWRKGQLLLGGVPGDRGSGVDGAGREQQLRNIGRVPETVKREARRAAECDLGQRTGAPWRVGAGVPAGTRPGLAADEPPFSRGQALPGYSPDGGADEAIWGWAREEATGNLCLGTKALVKERVGNFLASLASRKEEVKRRCRTVLQSRAEGLLRDSQPPSQPTANAHPTLALV